MNTPLTVITCTHNPRKDFLEKLLVALNSQTLPFDQWEYLLIDNQSDQPLHSWVDLSWHSQARHIQEDELGLTPARLRGIKEAKGNILIFVDDDNVLAPDYLEVALHISKDYSLIGAWGGQIESEFEEQPAEWTKPYWGLLAIREVDRDKWSNLLHNYETVPCGAGLCVRKIVAEKYTELVIQDPKRIAMDRKGKLLTSCGDSDLALTACDIGLGTGQFTSLQLIHLIPSFRIKADYLIKLAEEFSYSLVILESFRGKLPEKTVLEKQASAEL